MNALASMALAMTALGIGDGAAVAAIGDGAALTAITTPAPQQDAAGLAAAVAAIATEPIGGGRAAGMTIAVVRAADTLLLERYGLADVELDVPTPNGAVYEIGSVTKQFTAAAILLLQEEGKLSLDDDLSRWMPDYPLGGRRIPLRRLLDHTSGIKGYTEMPVFGPFTVQELPRDSLVTVFSAEPFDFEPGDALIYNNSAFFLLGLIIEKASGTTYEAFVEERLFAAAGMTDSRYCHKDELVPRRAKGYQPSADGLRPADYLNHLWPFSAGSLCSTATDLVRWNQALHGDGKGGDLLSAASYRELITPGALNDGTRVRYAKGLGITDRDGKVRIAHGGGINGYLSELRYFPEDDLSIAVLINTSGPVGPGAIADQIEDLVLGPVAPVVVRRFTGSTTPYLGSFRGASRGRRMTVTVSLGDGGELLVRQAGGGDPEPLRWLGGTTFGRGLTRYAFTLEEGEARTLRIDQVAGLFVLERISG